MKLANILFLTVLVIASTSTDSAQLNFISKAQEQKVNSSNKLLIRDINILSLNAIEYMYSNKNNCFSGWVIPEALDTTKNGTYTAKVSENELTIVGFGFILGEDGKNKTKQVLHIKKNNKKLEMTLSKEN